MQFKLESLSKGHRQEFLTAVHRSRSLHGRWTAAPQTRTAFEAYLKRTRASNHKGYLIRTGAGELAGVINLSDVVRGRFCSGYLGYYAFKPHQRHGYMTEGLRAVVSRAFRELRLHRLEANIQPGNEASRRLVRKLGFRCEGFSPRYLKMSGRWRDHERWAITIEDWIKQRPTGRER